MNKVLKSMMFAALAISAAHLQAHTNKTTLTTRSHGVNLALERSGGFNEHVMRNDKNRFGGNFQAVGFFNDSTDEAELAKYFLGADKATFTGEVAANQVTVAGKKFAGKDDSLTLKPNHSSYGVYLNYHQDLEKVLKGLHFAINLPIVHVVNELKATGAGAFKDLSTILGDKNKDLKFARIKDGKSEATGIADIDIHVGYEFLDKETYHACIDLGLTIPTGNDNKGEHVFEAIYGNGQHFGLGAGLGFGARIWGDHHHNLNLNAGLQYRYLFQAAEKRTLGLKSGSTVTPFGQYQALKAATGEFKDQVAAANVTTLNVNVTPGSQLDGIVSLAYNNGGFLVDGGYNLYFREEESLKLKDTWNEKAYTLDDTAKTPVTADSLSTAAATTPSQTTHKVFGNVGYMFRDWETPVSVAVGGHYEFVSSNSAVEGWGVNGRLGISF